MLAHIERLGERSIYLIQDLGRMGIFLSLAVRAIFNRPFRFGELVRQIGLVGASSLILIFFTASFTGMVLGLQGYYALRQFSAEGAIGPMVALTLLRELGPVLTALMIIGRVGSAICAEIGIMRNSEQIDALECMAVDPFRYLIAPKFLALIISVPLLTLIFNVVGILGGYVAVVLLLGLNPGSYFSAIEMSVVNQDINMGIIKSLVFALLIVWICAGRGYFVHQIRSAGFGAEGVSRATTQAVVISSISVLAANYLLTAILI
ncbi:MAG: ABC transporter permease [Desulfobulbaceae bacterium]|nr:MAG: ABC transporter permease [Desulfobulbaceae bacterium]